MSTLGRYWLQMHLRWSLVRQALMHAVIVIECEVLIQTLFQLNNRRVISQVNLLIF
jgi:hypothetical protein